MIGTPSDLDGPGAKSAYRNASPRSKPTLSKHAHSATPIGRRRPHSSATSSSGSCHAPSASAVATEEPRQPPNALELPSPAQPDTPSPTSRGTIASSAPTSILRPAPAHIAPTHPTRPRPRRGLTGYPPLRRDDGDGGLVGGVRRRLAARLAGRRVRSALGRGVSGRLAWPPRRGSDGVRQSTGVSLPARDRLRDVQGNPGTRSGRLPITTPASRTPFVISSWDWRSAS